MNNSDRQSVFDYRALRLILGCIAFTLPIIVSIRADGTILQSISASYHSDGSRDFFVGMLFIVGAFLWAYRGWTDNQARVSMIAAVAAILLAIFPTTCDGCTANFNSAVHYLSAATLFGILTYFCFVYFRADIKKIKGEVHTLGGKPQTTKERTRSGIYLACGYTMTICIVLMLIFLIPALSELKSTLRVIYWAEAIALGAFGVAWITAGKISLLCDADEALVLLKKKSASNDSDES
jgi:hypothetical protein